MQIVNLNVATILLNFQLPHIIQVLVDNIGNLKDMSYIFLNLGLGVGAFRGLSYLKSYKEKRDAATFTFWLQLRVRMMEIKSWLESEYSLVNCLYDQDIRSTWEGESGSDNKRIEIFKKLVQETLEFIKSSSDQIPAYIGWTDDYNKFIAFLTDVILFDISNGDNYFKFVGSCSIIERNKYIEEICTTIDRICNKIVLKQQDIENDL